MTSVSYMTNTLEVLDIKSQDELELKIRDGIIKLADVVKKVGPPSDTIAKPVKLPVPAAITSAQTSALEKLTKVFGKVVPKTKRALTRNEIKDLYEERFTLDSIETMAKKRKEDIRTSVVNHLDIGLADDLPTDKEGHVLIANTVPVDDTDQAFSWEVREGTPTFSPSILKELDEKGELDHSVYLRLTDQVRVVNEQKVMIELAKDPEYILDLIRKASVAGTPVGSLYVRTQK